MASSSHFKRKRQIRPRKVLRLITGEAPAVSARIAGRYRTLAFQIKFEPPEQFRGGGGAFRGETKLHCVIVQIRNRSLALSLRPIATKNELCAFRRQL